MVPVMPAQAGIHDFGRIDPQVEDGRNKPGHDGKRTAIVTPKRRRCKFRPVSVRDFLQFQIARPRAEDADR